jgi:hypothetical protein
MTWDSSVVIVTVVMGWDLEGSDWVPVKSGSHSGCVLVAVSDWIQRWVNEDDHLNPCSAALRMGGAVPQLHLTFHGVVFN